MKNKVQRLVLKKGDILLVKLPMQWYTRRRTAEAFYKQIKKRLLPRKNKVLMLPMDVDISVIGQEEIKEHISNIDLWDLWTETEDEGEIEDGL